MRAHRHRASQEATRATAPAALDRAGDNDIIAVIGLDQQSSADACRAEALLEADVNETRNRRAGEGGLDCSYSCALPEEIGVL